ncbi:MAG TPA: hypothetical protein VJU01_05110 [Gaiellaceae bacterium]|nr:hypothetical protein [Gaiellaceae bacterium]
MAGELLPIGMRPKLVASFDPPDAEARFREWETAHAETLAAIPGNAWRVEYGRTGVGPYVRVRVDEEHLPDGL